MSTLEYETVAFVDPYVLEQHNEHLFDPDDDEQQAILSKLVRMNRIREQRSAPRCPGSGHVALPSNPQAVLHPVEFGSAQDKKAAQYFTHVAVSNSTVVATTKDNCLHCFDQINEIPITCTSMVGHSQRTEEKGLQQLLSAAAKDIATVVPGSSAEKQSTNYVDPKDVVTKLFLDPMGRHAVVVFQSGVNLMFHIKRSHDGDEIRSDDNDDKEKKKKKAKKAKKSKAERSEKPQRYDILVPTEVSRSPAFCVESVAWDESNSFENTTGDVILGSQKHGTLVACRFEASGVAAMRHLFSFPAPLNRSPVHSVAMLREPVGDKRVAVLVAMDHKLFFFRSSRSTLESAFVLSELQVPETEAELAFLASSGSSASLPLKNYWSLPAVAPTTSGASSSSGGGGVSRGSAVLPAPDASHPVPSRVQILHPTQKYTLEQLPPTFTWVYYDTLVQGILLPFDVSDDGASAFRAAATGAHSSKGGHTTSLSALRISPASNAPTSSTATVSSATDILQLMRLSVRITSVEQISRLVGAAEYVLQFDTAAQPPVFCPTTVTPAPSATLLNLKSSSFPKGVTTGGATTTVTLGGTIPASYVTTEKVLRVTATYFYLCVVTQTKMYVFAHTPLLPLPDPAFPWGVRERLVLHMSLLTSHEQTAPALNLVALDGSCLVSAATASGNAVRVGSATTSTTTATTSAAAAKPSANALLYRLSDGCLDIQRDARFVNKLYLCCSRDIFEVPLPSLKRMFVDCLIQQAYASPASPAATEPPKTLASPPAMRTEGRGNLESGMLQNRKPCHLHGAQTSARSAAALVFRFVPPANGALVIDDSGCHTTGKPASATAASNSRERSGTVAPMHHVKMTRRATSRPQPGEVAYASFALMRLYGASRFPIRQQLRSNAFYSDSWFHIASSLSSKHPSIRKDVETKWGECLFDQERFLESAAKLGRHALRGVDVWFTKFAQLPSRQPLVQFCRSHLQTLAESGGSLDGRGAITVTCLSSATLVGLLDLCHDHGAQKETVPAHHPPHLLASTGASPKPLTLDKPRAALQQLLAEHKDQLPWSVVRTALFQIGGEWEVDAVCRSVDRIPELLQHRIAHGRYYDALELVIERAKKEFDESLCYDEEGYVHPGVSADLWLRYGGLFLQHYPVRMIRHGWIPYGFETGLDPLRLLPLLSRYDPKKNETNFEADAPPEEVHRWLSAEANRLGGDVVDDDNDTSPVELTATDKETVAEHVGITYLRHLGQEGYTDQGISNLLLRFLAASGTDDELVSFISGDKSLDLLFALRVCNQHQRVPAVVQIYFALGHLTEAIDLALAHNEISRAKKLVESVKEGTPGSGEQPSATRQELWKRVVAHVAKQHLGPKNALHLISESKNDVDVSHVIPHLSDDVMLSEFKTELLENVADFGQLMREVRQDIERAKSDVELLRGDVISARGGTLKTNLAKRCDMCGVSIWGSSHGNPILFRGCTHAFHTDCLQERWVSVRLRENAMKCFLCAPEALPHLLSQPLHSGGTEQHHVLPMV